MNFELMDEKLERELKRVVAAFGVSALSKSTCASLYSPGECACEGALEGHTFTCLLDSSGSPRMFMLDYVKRAGGYHSTRLIRDSAGQWHGHYREDGSKLMAGGIYRVGIEEADVVCVSGFPYVLSAHEKMELRLSMPREFWPSKWLDEERTAQAK